MANIFSHKHLKYLKTNWENKCGFCRSELQSFLIAPRMLDMDCMYESANRSVS